MNIDNVRERFRKDRFATGQTDIVIDDAGENYSKCSFIIRDYHLNGIGKVMGGAIFTLADFAVAVAANGENKTSVSLTVTINYLGQPRGKKLIAETNLVKAGKNVSVFQVNITDELGTAVANACSNCFNII